MRRSRPRRSRPRRAAGFTLVELGVVLLLVAILTSLGALNLTWALERARVSSAVADLGALRGALLRLATDCEGLPTWSSTKDPGLGTKPSWAATCWKGPYLRTWPATTPLGGTFRYSGPTKTGKKPANATLSAEGLTTASAQQLAAAIAANFGTSALGKLTYTSKKKTWSVELILGDRQAIR